MKKLIFALIVCIAFFSCATSQVCTEAPENSLICKYIPNPESADILLQLVFYELLKQNPSAKGEVAKVLDEATTNLSTESLLWTDIVAWVVSRSDYLKDNFGGEFVILSAYAGVLNRPVPITEFDKNLLKIHLERQKGILKMIGE